MQLFIQPIDVWLFRDGRPFGAGEDHRAVSLFPPTPYTMQGAIRTKVLMDKGVDLADYAGRQAQPKTKEVGQEIGFPGGDYGKLRLRGPFMAKRKEGGQVTRYFPLPADMVKVEVNGKEQHLLVNPLHPNKSPYTTNIQTNLLWVCTHEAVTEATGWLAEEELEKYLKGEVPAVTKASDLFVKEPRFGVAVDSGVKRPQEGLLYQVEFIRLQEGGGLWLKVDGVTLPKAGLLQLGGERKVAYYEEVADAPKLQLGGKAEGRFKLYFATPAYFSSGWQPGDGNWDRFFGKSVRLVTAAVPRAQMLGGAKVDIESQKGDFHKPMRPFVPAGSVYFFEADDAVAIPETVTEEGTEIGFGQVFIGRWDYV